MRSSIDECVKDVDEAEDRLSEALMFDDWDKATAALEDMLEAAIELGVICASASGVR